MGNRLCQLWNFTIGRQSPTHSRSPGWSCRTRNTKGQCGKATLPHPIKAQTQIQDEEEAGEDHHHPHWIALEELDLDDYSMTSESGEGHRHWRHQRVERRLAPVRLNLPIFHSTDANAECNI